MTISRLLTAGCVTVTLTLAAGCEQPTATSTEPAQESELRTSTSALTMKACPAPPGDPIKGQMRATRAFNYLVGSATYADASICGAAKTYLDQIRSGAATFGCTWTAPSSLTKICNLKAAVYKLNCSTRVSQSYVDAAVNAANALDACFGNGAGTFFYSAQTIDEAGNGLIYVDPEPARLSSSLSGNNGSAVAGNYVNSGGATSIVKWSSSYSTSSSLPAAGTPCSTGDLAIGAETIKVLQASGSYRRCL